MMMRGEQQRSKVNEENLNTVRLLGNTKD